MSIRPGRALLAGLAAIMLLTAQAEQAVHARDASDPIGELILFSSDQADRLVVLFENSQTTLTEASRVRLREFADHLRQSAKDVRRVLVVGTTASTGDAAADQDLAIHRALSARDELIRLSGMSPSLFLVQASRSTSIGKSAGWISVEFNSQNATEPRGPAQVRTAWDMQRQRWLLVCADGSVLPERLSAPDDFSAAHQCQPASEITTPTRTGPGPVVRWESKASRWVLRCPDGSPLKGQAQDPDDFHALSRCRP